MKHVKNENEYKYLRFTINKQEIIPTILHLHLLTLFIIIYQKKNTNLKHNSNIKRGHHRMRHIHLTSVLITKTVLLGKNQEGYE